jgi:hypothetical protein
MSNGIRLRVWLFALVPLAIVAGVVVWLVMPSAKSGKGRGRGAESNEVSSSKLPPPDIVSSMPPRDRPSSTATTNGAAPPPTAPSESSASNDRPIEPEDIPELDALSARKPSGFASWSEDQKRAYKDKLLGDLDFKQRALERDLDRAMRSGDEATAEQKRATLRYLDQQKQRFFAEAGPRWWAQGD